MKWYEDFDVTEVLALLVLAWIATVSAYKGDMGIANTVVGVIGGYLTKSLKNGVQSALKVVPKRKKPPKKKAPKKIA